MTAFYSADPEPGLRLGDVITGFCAATPTSHHPTGDLNFSIAVTKPSRFVILTPCCSIERGSLIVAPLGHVRASLLGNEHLSGDLTQINRHVHPRKTLSATKLEALPSEQREKILASPSGYMMLQDFVYAPHPLLPEYTLSIDRMRPNVACGSYVVDFKTLFRVDCDLANRGKPIPSGMKLLQLTPHSRRELREKLAHFFLRPAEEDVVELQTA